jgi:hypothetical protein
MVVLDTHIDWRFAKNVRPALTSLRRITKPLISPWYAVNPISDSSRVHLYERKMGLISEREFSWLYLG